MKKSNFGRPPTTATEIMFLKSGKWFDDDGKPHLAFSFKDGYIPIAASNVEKYLDIAMDFTCIRWDCANGRDLRRTSRKPLPGKDK